MFATLPTKSKKAAPENIFAPHNIIDEDDIGNCCDVGMNTDATFTPYCNVIFSIRPTEHQISVPLRLVSVTRKTQSLNYLIFLNLNASTMMITNQALTMNRVQNRDQINKEDKVLVVM